MTLVSWLLVFGALIILALVIDFARRFFTNSPFEEFDSLDSAILSYSHLNEFDELPNGGKAQLVVSDEPSDVDTASVADCEIADIESADIQLDASIRDGATVDDANLVKDTVTQPADQPLADEMQALDDEMLTESIIIGSAETTDADSLEALSVEQAELNDNVIIAAFSDWQQDDVADAVNDEPDYNPLPDDLSTEYEYARHYQEDTQLSAAEAYQDNEQEQALLQSHTNGMTNDITHDTQNDTLDDNISDSTLVSTKPLEPLDITRPVYEVLETSGIVQADLFGDVAVDEPASNTASMATTFAPAQADNTDEAIHADTVSMLAEQTEQAQISTSNNDNDTDTAGRDSADALTVANDASVSTDQNILLDYTKVPLPAQTPTAQKISQHAMSKSLTARFRQFVFPFSEDSHYSDELHESQDKTIVLDASLDPRKRQIELNIALRLQLPSQGALGKNIVDLLSHCHCEFDREHGLFHRYESADAEYMQFSVAADTSDGNFVDEFENEHYMSIVFFMVLPGVNKGTYALECMVKTARYLAESLHGELFDFRQGVLCEQTIIHFNKTIRDYERRRLVKLRAEGQR